MSALSFRNRKEGWEKMVRALVIGTLVLGSLAVAACNTVRGAAADVNSVANCTENTMNTGHCK